MISFVELLLSIFKFFASAPVIYVIVAIAVVTIFWHIRYSANEVQVYAPKTFVLYALIFTILIAIYFAPIFYVFTQKDILIWGVISPGIFAGIFFNGILPAGSLILIFILIGRKKFNITPWSIVIVPVLAIILGVVFFYTEDYLAGYKIEQKTIKQTEKNVGKNDNQKQAISSQYIKAMGEKIEYNDGDISFELPNGYELVVGQGASTNPNIQKTIYLANSSNLVSLAWHVNAEPTDAVHEVLPVNNTFIRQFKPATKPNRTLNNSFDVSLTGQFTGSFIEVYMNCGYFNLNEFGRSQARECNSQDLQSIELLKQSFRLLN